MKSFRLEPDDGKSRQTIGDLEKGNPIATIILILIIIGTFGYMFFGSLFDFNIPESTPAVSSTDNTINTPVQVKPQGDLLELISFRCYSEYGYFHIVGEVKNISSQSLDSVLAVGTTRTVDGEFIKSKDALIEYNPILSGQTSPFEVMMTLNPAMKKCNVSFKEFFGGTISTKRN